ncbi:hypothetical protein GON03_19210 [Nocardioides sp. MAH-18]|uniref:Uncharacterized protein n=1 Tax=Nocardioides agri TaxID=2682843 RepID=A0A6L6XVB0_9ACTN|nr:MULTISPECIES: hypothetical protein [unclassified Nocardioides]MBA2952148.1 hypothetical protein [Nocardioides sp. CGMCC 1.13656]MVQ51314.1 hypothetical protein [Nocardioides sp. MAH-18]
MTTQLCGARYARNRAITCGKQPGHLDTDPFHKFNPDDPETCEWLDDDTAPPAATAASTAEGGGIERVQERIDNLLSVADRFDHPGGSRRLAQRARDKAAGMEAALRLLGVPENGVFGDPLIHRLLSTPPGVQAGGDPS